MTSPFVTATELADALRSDAPPVVFDASLILHSPGFDGDYRRESGYPSWVAAHIPGSRHVDVSSQFSDATATLHYTHPAPQAIADELARLGVRATDEVVVYDSTGTIWAARLWYLLTWIGVPTRVLDGGAAGWSAAGLPLESGAGQSWPRANPWVGLARRDAWISKNELVRRAADDTRPLVCGLPAGSFTGASPTRYSRRGRIPGSVNVSSRDLFAADGTVVAHGHIREAYQAAGVSVEASEVLLYCGGGISASASALTLAEIGVTDVRIYDGSLEEWSADPTLPLELG